MLTPQPARDDRAYDCRLRERMLAISKLHHVKPRGSDLWIGVEELHRVKPRGSGLWTGVDPAVDLRDKQSIQRYQPTDLEGPLV